jgi:NADPH:quinone reductase-like Zn-dependent oxidoreductase
VSGVVFDGYGPPEVVRLEEVELPAPKPGAVLVRVHATTATRTDCGLRSAGLRAGQRVLVCGASGSIGIATVQMAKHLGAHVTAACTTKNVELVRSFGPDVVIEYEQQDFTKNGETYDLVFDDGRGALVQALPPVDRPKAGCTLRPTASTTSPGRSGRRYSAGGRRGSGLSARQGGRPRAGAAARRRVSAGP